MKTVYYARLFNGEEIEVGTAYSTDDQFRIEKELEEDDGVEEYWRVFVY